MTDEVRREMTCAWCGKTVGLSNNGKRPRQHLNGLKLCIGSGQPVENHDRLREAAERNRKERYGK